MELKYIDAHCHLQFPEYDLDREEIISRMLSHGVGAIAVGVDRASSEKAIALVEKHDHLFATVGLHPNHAAGELFDMDSFRQLAGHPKVVAIGECGLDYFRTEDDGVKRAQEEALRAHIALAVEIDKPLIIHCRPTKGLVDAYEDLIKILGKFKAEQGDKLKGDIHFFVGSEKQAIELVAFGFTVSFTAVITFARDYDSVIRAVPLTSILAETDSPYVAPASRRGKRNDPLAVKEVAERIAEIRGEEAEKVRQTLFLNASRLFGLDLQ